MYRRAQPVGMSGLLDSISKFFKGIKVTAPPIQLPQIQLPTTYQIPGTVAPPAQAPVMTQATPDWVLPAVGIGVALLVLPQLMRGRR